MLTRIVRRMLRSNLFGFIAGLLMAMEGMSLVLARTAILDIFLQTFVIAGFGALVVDRDQMRARLGAAVSPTARTSAGRTVARPAALAAASPASCSALACAVKWTALSFFVVFVLLSLVWDRAAFKSAGVRRPTSPWPGARCCPRLGSLLAAPVGAYLLTYLGWFTGENSWNRHWADTHGPSTHLDLFGVHVPFTWGVGARPDPLARRVHAATRTASTRT